MESGWSEDGDDDGPRKQLHTPDTFTPSRRVEDQVLMSPAQEARQQTGEKATGSIGPCSSTYNLTSTILGAGLLSLPKAMRYAGVIPGVVFLLIIAFLARYGCLLVLKSYLRTGKAYYDDLALCLSGRVLSIVTQWAILLLNIGACAGYMIVVFDLFQPSLAEFFPTVFGVTATGHDVESDITEALSDPVLVTAVLVFGVVFPLCCLESLGSLRYTSMLAFFFALFLVVAVAFRGVQFMVEALLDGHHHDKNSSTLSLLLGGLTGYHEDPATLGVNIYDTDPATLGVNHNSSDFACEGGLQLFSTDPLKVIQAMPIFCFAFICHLNVLPVYQVLKRRTPKSMRRVFETSIFFCCICYIFIGILGYARFCDRTPGNILAYETSPGSDTTKFSYFAADDYLITVARIAETLTCVLALPLIQYSTRMALHSFLLYTCRLCQSPKEAPQQKVEEGLKSPLLETDESPGKEADSEESRNKCRTVVIRCAEALGLTIVEFAIAIAIPELSFVFGLMGATLATFLCFILPALFYLLATKHVGWPACLRSCCCCCNPKGDLDDAEETDTISPVDRASAQKQQCKRALSVLQVVFGVVVGVLGTFVTIKSRFD